MRLSKLPFCIAITALFFLQFSAPTASHADTYQIVGLGIDNVQFYGMDDSGHVVFSTGNSYCGGQYSVCYGSDANGWSGVAPAYSWDNGVGCSPTLPPGTSDLAAVCNNGRVAFYGVEPGNGPLEGLYSGSNPPQLVSPLLLSRSESDASGLSTASLIPTTETPSAPHIYQFTPPDTIRHHYSTYRASCGRHTEAFPEQSKRKIRHTPSWWPT